MAEIETESHHCDSLCVPVRLPLIIDHFFLLLLLLLSLTGQVDLWTRTSSGCPCASNKTLAGRSSNSGESCSCCVRGGCQCEDNPLRCAQCGLESYCTNSKLTTVTICSLSLSLWGNTLCISTGIESYRRRRSLIQCMCIGKRKGVEWRTSCVNRRSSSLQTSARIAELLS